MQSRDFETPQTIAAVDLGSNSFHMVIARVVDGHPVVLDRLKDSVRLAAGLNAHHELEPDAMSRALACLSRFGERLRAMAPGSVRAVGTNTLRKARNAPAFLLEAQHALGHPIEVISGLEEARMIYLGVATSAQASATRRLVIDIGGGSTEFIIGQGLEPEERESKYMGCVSYSQRFFAGGAVTEAALNAAVLAARQELQPMDVQYRRLGWQEVMGASGTIRAVGAIAEAQGWSAAGISREALHKIARRLVRAGNISEVRLQGLAEDRRSVFPGGLAILLAAFESLGIEHMSVSDGALREGLLCDLLGRFRREDIRDLTVTRMRDRYHVDTAHARRVERTARDLMEQVADIWDLDERGDGAMLAWACQLHEIGLAIAHARYHKHGSYLLENSDMPGFSRQDQQLLWALVRSHRRRFKPHRFDGLPGRQARTGRRLCLLLRLAVLLNRSRHDEATPQVRLEVQGRVLRLSFVQSVLAKSPLMQADLADEKQHMQAAGWTLEIQE